MLRRLDLTARQINAHIQRRLAPKEYRWFNEPERLDVSSPLPSFVSSDLALDGLLWVVHLETGKCSGLLLPNMSLPFSAEEIQMSAQDPSFNQAPINVLRVCLRAQTYLPTPIFELCSCTNRITTLPLPTQV